MNLVKQKAEIWVPKHSTQHIARCARVCYASDANTNDDKLVKALVKNGHLSMLRHDSCYYIIPTKFFGQFKAFGVERCPYIRFRMCKKKKSVFVSTNAQFLYDNQDVNLFLSDFVVSEDEFFKHAETLPLRRVTVYASTQIAIASEFNRVGPQNISQQSTRYVELTKKGIPLSLAHWMGKFDGWKKVVEHILLKTCTWHYQIARKVLGLHREDARYFLPVGTETKVAYTYTIAEWEHILDLRLRGTTGKPHPDAKALALLIEKEIKKQGLVGVNIAKSQSM